MAKQTFAEWMTKVDAAIAKKAWGFTSSDLADINYRDLYEDGVSAASAARAAIKNEMG